MVTPAIDEKVYPEILYYGKRIGKSVIVYKKLLPDGISTELDPTPSQKLCNHSPDGFNFGYGGSGPAQLALALLLDATSDPETALAYYTDFKWHKVSVWGKKWTILRSEILSWLKEEHRRELEKRTGRN